MRIIFAILISFILLLGGSCTGSKSYSKKARKLQEAGLNDEAAAFYYQALQRNPKNVDAKIGLRITGQIQIESTLTSFYKAYSVSNYKEAVYKYQQAMMYKRNYGYFVTMEIPAYYEEYYQEMLSVYLDQQYENAGDHLYNERFKEAHSIYKEIISLDPEFKDVKELSLKALLEPMYRDGVKAFDDEKYKRCYYIMSDILAKKNTYKDAIDFKDRALEEGQVTIAVLEFQTAISNKSHVAQTIQAEVVSQIIGYNDPFVKVLDRSNLESLIKEQKINVAEDVYGQSAIKTGELLGADLLIKGKLLNYKYTGGQIRRVSKSGFEKYKVKETNPETKKTYKATYYRKVDYVEYKGSASLLAEVQYQMVSAETGEVLNSDLLNNHQSDYVNFISFSGNTKYLYKGTLTTADKATRLKNGSYIHVSNLVSLKGLARESKRTLKTEHQLSLEVINGITRNISRSINSFDLDEL
ncbi:MAG: CsgG/HfaB family protein [Salibacteraceae bacterium]